MEAGNRCFDDQVPEEVNRRVIDHSSDILLPYTDRSRQNLLAEGIHSSRIFVTGNPIREVIDHYTTEIPPIERPYYLVTLHRQENVDSPERLKKFVEVFKGLDKKVIWPMHPRTRKYVKDMGIDPVGFVEFTGLERQAYCVLTDSGTVQEECAIFGVPCVTLRDTTERPETIEAGSNFIAGCEPESIRLGIQLATAPSVKKVPSEYMTEDVSNTVVKIVLGYYQ